ncbi:hypothetical protein TMM008_04970 [Pseudomonas sp. 008]|nr:hypothetical protein TMM008_04970 [Pseudomonas sp. 008]
MDSPYLQLCRRARRKVYQLFKESADVYKISKSPNYFRVIDMLVWLDRRGVCRGGARIIP